jgi:hypothetical protein
MNIKCWDCNCSPKESKVSPCAKDYPNAVWMDVVAGKPFTKIEL